MRLDHIQLAMPAGEEDLARAFFTGVLGMKEQEKPYPLSERGGVWFRSGEVIVHLGVEPNFTPQKKAHPAFLIDELDHLASRLSESGHSVKWDESLPNRKRFYSADPFGNRLEFMADGDGFTQVEPDRVE